MKHLAIIITAIFIQFNLGAQDVYSFKVKDVTGSEFNLADLKGNKVMIVNVASKCGLTPQYDDLQKLYTQYQDHNFVIIGFPANNFLKQEPGTNEEISTFCKVNYGVTFPIMSKISVKGKDIHPLYKYLTESTETNVKWNFQKYLINEYGTIVGVVMPREKPDSERIINWINTGVLDKK